MNLYTLTLINDYYESPDVLIGVFTTKIDAYRFITSHRINENDRRSVLFAQDSDNKETDWEEQLNDLKIKNGGYEVYLIETIKANEGIKGVLVDTKL